MSFRRPLALAFALTLAALAAASCSGAVVPYASAPPATGVAPDLPADVRLKTPTESFTHNWYAALRGGRIWIRRNEETSGVKEPWHLLTPDGYPHHRLRPSKGSPPVVRTISADGENLIAVDEAGLVYYTKLPDPKKLEEPDWIDLWGLPGMGDPLYVGFPRRGLAISHRGELAEGYEDIDGNMHPIWAGVSTLYALSADGRSLIYADPWLPAHFGRRICLPNRDRTIAVGLSASASTVFVVDAAGNLFTRLADYDSLGENWVLAYTYVRGKHDSRTLPPEDWVAEPPVPGRITALLTVLQTGKGNAGRELRVAGVDASGAGGYWHKGLRDPAWSFRPTGVTPAGPFLGNAASPETAPRPEEILSPPKARDLIGTIERPAGAVAAAATGARITLAGFDPDCPPATLRLAAGGETLELPLHLRRPKREADARVTDAKGTVLRAPDRPIPVALAPLVKALFGDAPISTVDLEIEGAGATVLVRGDAPGLGRRIRISFR